MRVALFTTRSFGSSVIDALLGLGIHEYDLTVVTTNPHEAPLTPEGVDIRYWNEPEDGVTMPGIKQSDWVASGLEQERFDACFAAHWFEKIPTSLLRVAPTGVLSYHPSLLPAHRGKDSVRDTIAAKDTIAGGVVYRMDDGYDTGPIVAWDWCPVWEDDDASSLWRRELFPIGVRLITHVAQELLRGNPLKEMPQDRTTLAAKMETMVHRT